MGYKDQATKYQAASGGKEIAGKLVDIGEVDHVILSDSDDNILTVDSGEENPKLVDTQIGSARIRKVNDFSTNEKQLTKIMNTCCLVFCSCYHGMVGWGRLLLISFPFDNVPKGST